MAELLERHFGKIGARIKTRPLARRRERTVLHFEGAGLPPAVIGRERPRYEIDIRRDKQGEYFDLATDGLAEFKLLQAREDQRHLLLLGSDGKRFLCGHDERHWFVAGIADRVSTVTDAKRSLMPAEVRAMVAQIPATEVDNRNNRVFRRQGEWFFIPVRKEIKPDFILRNEPMRKTAQNKPHVCSELYREGGEGVWVFGREVYDADTYALMMADPEKRHKVFGARPMMRNANVYVRGTVTHADHSTVKLEGWHRVFMNAEYSTSAVAFLD